MQLTHAWFSMEKEVKLPLTKLLLNQAPIQKQVAFFTRMRNRFNL